MKNYLDKAKEKFYKIVADKNLLNKKIIIKSRVLTPEEAIGNPDRSDFPLLTGKERIMEAKFKNSIGHVFTDMPGNYTDTLKNILNKEIKNNFHRAVFIASANAVMRELDLIDGTVHCKNNEPEKCADKLVVWLKKYYPGKRTVAQVGFQPAFIEKLSKKFTLNVLDLNKDNFGEKYGVPVFDGNKFYKDIIRRADIVLATGTVFVNGSIEKIAKLRPIEEIIFYGVTVSGISKLLKLKRVCFYPK
ncbi:MAG TPA: hypothetical protein DCX95_05220 [Elusimicrobia bacterium]|nr:hypothetical protein [Elusimicrobiota bacterium]